MCFRQGYSASTSRARTRLRPMVADADECHRWAQIVQTSLAGAGGPIPRPQGIGLRRPHSLAHKAALSIRRTVSASRHHCATFATDPPPLRARRRLLHEIPSAPRAWGPRRSSEEDRRPRLCTCFRRHRPTHRIAYDHRRRRFRMSPSPEHEQFRAWRSTAGGTVLTRPHCLPTMPSRRCGLSSDRGLQLARRHPAINSRFARPLSASRTSADAARTRSTFKRELRLYPAADARLARLATMAKAVQAA